MNFATHVATFAAINSGLWFVHILKTTTWEWLPWLTGGWVTIVLVHLIYIAAIANYSEPIETDAPPKST
jgi:hypothetical protein